MNGLRPHVTEKVTATVSTPTGRFKILKVVFSRRDGSVFVTFPYYEHSEGVVSVATFPGGSPRTININLERGGRATSHRVKYSHHPDGNVLFSQDGRVKSELRKESLRLDQDIGHFFTVQLQGIQSFETIENPPHEDIQSEREMVLDFGFPGEPEAIKIIGYWYTKENVSRQKLGAQAGPRVTLVSPHKVYNGFLISPPDNNPSSQACLILACEGITLLDREVETCLIFIGGFDRTDVINDLSQDTNFLSFIYPITDIEGLKRRIGSIDFEN